MVVHFVCLGNVYRSRLAEAYLNSKNLTDVEVISSGIDAANNGNKPISWLTQRLFEIYKLIPFQKPNWTQTTKKLLDSANLTIFFDKKYYQFCLDKLKFHSDNFEIWKIADLDGSIQNHAEKIRVTEEAFKIIQQKVNNLIKRKKF